MIVIFLIKNSFFKNPIVFETSYNSNFEMKIDLLTPHGIGLTCILKYGYRNNADILSQGKRNWTLKIAYSLTRETMRMLWVWGAGWGAREPSL